jgi:hypothetical protein
MSSSSHVLIPPASAGSDRARSTGGRRGVDLALEGRALEGEEGGAGPGGWTGRARGVDGPRWAGRGREGGQGGAGRVGSEGQGGWAGRGREGGPWNAHTDLPHVRLAQDVTCTCKNQKV